MDARAFASPKRLRPRRRIKPAHDDRLVFCTARLCSAPRRKERRAALRPGNGEFSTGRWLGESAIMLRSGRSRFGILSTFTRVIRISTIFVAICMVLVAASLGLVLYSVAALSMSESAIVALTALTFMILYNAVSMRLRDRSDVNGQIADLSRGTADLARQVAEFGRRLAAVEGRVVSANSANADRVQTLAGEIAELGVLVQQLAVSVAGHDELLASGAPAAPSRGDPRDDRQADAVAISTAPAGTFPAAPEPDDRSDSQILAAVKNAIEANRLDIYLQP